MRSPSRERRKNAKTQKHKNTIHSEDSLLVTDATTNSPALGLSTAERTGSPVFRVLWWIAKAIDVFKYMKHTTPSQESCLSHSWLRFLPFSRRSLLSDFITDFHGTNGQTAHVIDHQDPFNGPGCHASLSTAYCTIHIVAVSNDKCIKSTTESTSIRVHFLTRS